REGQRCLPGSVAFLLYDTYGFPLDLQEVIGREQGFVIDQPGFVDEMQKARDRSAGSKVGETAVAEVYREVLQKTGPVAFTGYERERGDSRVLALIANGSVVDALDAGQEGEVVVAATPFYGESGGQVGDVGSIASGE